MDTQRSMTGSTLFETRRVVRTAALLGGAILAVAVIGFAVHGLLKREVEHLAEESLDSIADSMTAGMTLWAEGRRDFVGSFARRPLIREWARASLDGDVDAQSWMGQAVADAGAPLGFPNYLLLDHEGRVRVMDGQPVSIRLPAEAEAQLSAATDGPVITPPLLMPVDWEGRVQRPKIVAASPLVAGGGRRFGFLVLLADPERFMGRLLEQGSFGVTGETYAVDTHGRMVSPNRFADFLKDRGLIRPDATSPIHEFEVRDPGLDLSVTGDPPPPLAGQPLTRAAAAVVAGEQGTSLEPYRDYRGVSVIGTWHQVPEMGIGLITEIDAAEAYHPLQTLRLIFGALLLALTLGVVVAIVIWSRGAALNRRAMKAEAQLRQLGQYRLERKLGEGGMGEVYLARHAMLRRETAVKMVTGGTSEEDLALFEREVRLCCQLTHPNTIQIYDYGRDASGTFYYAMECLRGADLETIVERTGPMPPGRVIHVLTQCCGSLAEAHRHKLIHRDIKPANIFLTTIGGIPDFVKILDFGLCKSVDKRAQQLSSADVISGTPPYMCPEIIQQAEEVDGRSDLYSLGVVGYFLLTGQVPFEGANVMDTLMAHLKQEPPPPRTVTGEPFAADLETVIMRCLAKDPADRPADADELKHELMFCEDALVWTEADARRWWAERWKEDPNQLKSMPISTSGAPSLVMGDARIRDA